jgi:hypothetical protein
MRAVSQYQAEAAFPLRQMGVDTLRISQQCIAAARIQKLSKWASKVFCQPSHTSKVMCTDLCITHCAGALGVVL